MTQETISRIEILDTGELFVGLVSQGMPMYQYVYREAAGVYWDQDRHGFKSTAMKEMSCSQWFKQIINTVHAGLGVELTLSANTKWLNISEEQKNEIQGRTAT